MLTASSCGNTGGDPVITVLKSSSPDANANTLSCVTGNDNGGRVGRWSPTVGWLAGCLPAFPPHAALWSVQLLAGEGTGKH